MRSSPEHLSQRLSDCAKSAVKRPLVFAHHGQNLNTTSQAYASSARIIIFQLNNRCIIRRHSLRFGDCPATPLSQALPVSMRRSRGLWSSFFNLLVYSGVSPGGSICFRSAVPGNLNPMSRLIHLI